MLPFGPGNAACAGPAADSAATQARHAMWGLAIICPQEIAAMLLHPRSSGRSTYGFVLTRARGSSFLGVRAIRHGRRGGAPVLGRTSSLRTAPLCRGGDT